MKVLVTGGAGFIGSHTCKALARAGHEVVVYDSLVTGHADAVKWGPLERGDIRDRHRLDAVFARHRPDLVMHFAALAYVGESVRDPAAYYDVNVAGALNVLSACITHDVDRFVFSSTCATYGTPVALPICESTPQRPINPYGFTKLAVETALRDYEAAYGLRWVAPRYFNAAGADPEGELSEEHEPETHAIPLAIRAALGTGPRFRIFGRDFDTFDGTAIRDYVHVSDLAAAHVLAAEHLVAGKASAALNLGTGRGHSVLEILKAVEVVTGRAVPAEFGPRRPGDPAALFADASLARRALGWQPRFTEISDIIATAARWFEARPAPAPTRERVRV